MLKLHVSSYGEGVQIMLSKWIHQESADYMADLRFQTNL